MRKPSLHEAALLLLHHRVVGPSAKRRGGRRGLAQRQRLGKLTYTVPWRCFRTLRLDQGAERLALLLAPDSSAS
jgi:hypothetical protein